MKCATSSQLLTMVSIGFLLVLTGCWPTKTTDDDKLAFQAPTLMEEYVKDAAAADKKYKGKEMIVSGVIAGIRRDQGIVILKGAPGGVSNAVECELTQEGRSVFDNLVQGQGIVTQGTNGGWNFGALRLKDCTVTNY